MQVLHCTNIDHMDELSYKVGEEYGFRIKKITSVSNDVFIADTKNRKLLIEKTDCKETHLIYITGLYDHIKDRGFKNVIRIYAAKTGKRYISMYDRFYIVSDYIDKDGDEFGFTKNEYNIIKFLADFHRATQGYCPPLGGKVKSDWGKWIEKYKKQYRGLKRYKDQVIEKESRSSFEEMFLKNCDVYLNRMEMSINVLKNNGFLDNVEESMRKHQICIGNFKTSNFCKRKSGIYIKSLDKCRYDMIEKDIGDILQKLIEYGSECSEARLAGLISLYHKKNPLNRNSMDIIKAFIMFPDEYEKVCSRYYKGKSKWTEDIYIKKLNGAISFEEKKTGLIEALGDIKLRLRGV